MAVAPNTPALSPPRTLADALLPRAKTSVATDIALVVGATLFLALCARISIPLPGTPVPITGQTFGVLLTGMLLGCRRGALALALYLAEGGVGLPVFAGGSFGFVHLIGPTAGYLWSYPFAAALMGLLAERGWDRRPATSALAMAIGSTLILAAGTLYLALFIGDLHKAFLMGAAPFVLGDAIKMLAATFLVPAGWKTVR